MTTPINITYNYTLDLTSNPGNINIGINYLPADIGLQNQAGYGNGGQLGPVADHANGIFTSVDDIASYYFSAAATMIVSQLNTGQTTIVYVPGSLVVVDDQVANYVATTPGALAASGVMAGTYTGPASITVDTKGRVTSAVSGAAPSFSYPSKSLNTSYQNNTSQNMHVSTAIDIACTLTLTGGQTGTVVFEIANDTGFTSGVQTINSTANGNTGTLTIGLALTQTATATLAGIVPAGKFYRYRTVNTTGTPTFTFRSSQEVLI